MNNLAVSLLFPIFYTGIFFSINILSYHIETLDSQSVTITLEWDGEHDENENTLFRNSIQEDFVNKDFKMMYPIGIQNSYPSIDSSVYSPPPEI